MGKEGLKAFLGTLNYKLFLTEYADFVGLAKSVNTSYKVDKTIYSTI